MSHDHAHHAGHPAYCAAVITASDRSAAGLREDAAGPAVRDLLERDGYEVVSLAVVPDDRALLGQAIRNAAEVASLVVTTGGTGLSMRDVTPEATADVCDRMVPGIGEAMRAASAAITPFAWLSRACAGTLGRTLVVNVPGSPKAAVENLEAVLVPIAHGLKTLTATAPLDCAAEAENVAGEHGDALAAGDAPAAGDASTPAAPEPADLAAKSCVLLDFDGTLADTKRCIVETAIEVLLGFGLTREEIGDAGRLVGPPFPAAFSLVYGLSEEDAEEVTRRYRAIYSKLGPESHPLFGGIYELLEDLRVAGRHLAIVSSKNYKLIDAALEDTGIAGMFDAVVSSRDPKDVGKQQLVTRALEELSCAPADAVMVGDRFYDIEGAAACGVDSLGVYLGNTAQAGELEQAGATRTASSVSEMRAILLG